METPVEEIHEPPMVLFDSDDREPSDFSDPLPTSLPQTNADPYRRALVLDSDRFFRYAMERALSREGWTIDAFAGINGALPLAATTSWSLIICGTNLREGTPRYVLQAFAERIQNGLTSLVVAADEASTEEAMDLMAQGATDYLVKPLRPAEVLEFAQKARERAQAADEEAKRAMAETASVQTIKAADTKEYTIAGRSPAMIEVSKQISKVAKTDYPCFISGETGTGKEVVARNIHRHSTRAKGPFIAINCGALTESLLESELFGYMKGAFTGAAADRRGLWEEADGGTLFLDEITETPLSFQIKLLRVLQEGEIRRVGATRSVRVNVRILAASNRDVAAEVAAGRFREDLYYRLNIISLKLPPLRERDGDVELLIEHFLKKARRTVQLSSEAGALLRRYLWPGNVRELEGAITRAAALCDGIIRVTDLPDQIIEYWKGPARAESKLQQAISREEEWRTLDEIIDWWVLLTYERTGRVKQPAADLLKIHISTFNKYLQRALSDRQGAQAAALAAQNIA